MHHDDTPVILGEVESEEEQNRVIRLFSSLGYAVSARDVETKEANFTPGKSLVSAVKTHYLITCDASDYNMLSQIYKKCDYTWKYTNETAWKKSSDALWNLV